MCHRQLALRLLAARHRIDGAQELAWIKRLDEKPSVPGKVGTMIIAQDGGDENRPHQMMNFYSTS